MEIVMRGVTKSYAGRLVLDGLTMTVRAGETVALIGPSGGGKSTLLRCINGLTAFDAGNIQIGEVTLKAGAPDRDQRHAVHQLRRSFGMVFQDFQLFPHMTALGNVMEAPRRVLGWSAKQAADRAHELLARVGLADHARKYPRQLSGGQQQRVAIARVLAMKPAGLLCDEITSALDPELKHEVLVLLEELRREGLTLLMVTHEIGFARRVADRVAVFADGKLIEDGAPAEVLEQPKTERAQQFLRRVMV